MKKLMTLLPMLVALTLCAQEETQVIKKNLSFANSSSDNLLIVENINGSLNVEGYDGQKVMLEVTKTIKYKSESIRKAAEEIEIGVVEKGDVILVYMKNPCQKLDPNTLTSDEIRENRNWNWKNNCKWRPKYDYRLDYSIKVPKNINLDISTINQGDILVKEVAGDLEVNNINGSIKLERIIGNTKATTINGDLDLLYDKNPSGSSRYYSLNGDINAFFQPQLSAEVFFKSFNGEFFTDMDDISSLPVQVKTEKVEGDGISYKIGGKAGIKVGNGEATLDFETFNGNVYLKNVDQE